MIRKVTKSYEDYSSLEACIKAVLNILNEFEQRISDIEENNIKKIKMKKTDEERIKELNQRAKKEKTKSRKLKK